MPSDLRYWSSGDYESDESLANSFSKYCMDPWDLENYAYMQNIHDSQNDSLELSSEQSSYGEPLEPTSSFYYAPIKSSKKSVPTSSKLDSEYGNAKYAEIEDLFYGDDNHNRCHVHRQVRHKEIEENYKMAPVSLEPVDDIPIYNITRRVSSTPAYGYSDRRPSHLSPQRRMSYSYGDDRYEYYPQPIYAKLEDNRIYEYKKNHVIYDVVQTNKFKPDNFGLSRYGHLQIDYSYSWNNLDKYIHT